MAKMTTADRKGDTARGAKAVADANARRWNKEQKARQQVTGRTGHAPTAPTPEPSPAYEPTPDEQALAAKAAAEFKVVEADLDDLPADYHPMFQQMCIDRNEFKLKEKSGEDAEVFRKSADDIIRSLFADVGYNRVNLPDAEDGSPGLVAVECKGTTASSISATKLLELGVDADIIAAATVPGNPYYFVQVRPRTKKEQAEYEFRQRVRQGAKVQ